MKETSDEHQLSPRVKLTPGSPVRVSGRSGLFRFVRIEREDDRPPVAVVIGPIGKAEGERIVSPDQLKSAGRTPESAVAMSPEARQLSTDAQKRKRR